eukprot:ANDGO_03932.mRNA.1 hypothetical protein
MPPAKRSRVKSDVSESEEDDVSRIEKLVEMMRERDALHDKLVSEFKSQIDFLKKQSRSSSSSSSSFHNEKDVAKIRELEGENKHLMQKIAELKEENEAVRKELEKASSIGKGKKLKYESASATTEDANKEVMRMFSSLTGMNIEYDEEDRKYRCSCTNTYAKKIVVFELAKTQDGEIEYTPLQIHVKNGELPAFLSDTIYFDESQMPMFALKMLQALFQNASSAGTGSSA